MPGETLHSELHEAKDHAKEAARSMLLAVRSAIDFAINQLGTAEQPMGKTRPPDSAPTEPAGPESSAPASPSSDEAAGSGS